MDVSEKSCPVCGNHKIKTLYHFSSLDVAQHLVLDKKGGKHKQIIKQAERLWNNKRCDICSCPNCIFEFAWPFVAGDQLFYSTVYDAETIYPEWKWEYQRSYAFIEKFIQSGSDEFNLLEVGAGNGAFLRRVSENLLGKKNIYATEYSEKGIERMEREGIKCYQKSISELQAENLIPAIDVICMFQVLEHLSDIKNNFKSLNAITKQNAVFIIAVPNPIQRKYFDSKKIFLDIPPIHIGRYFKETFVTLGKQFGWKIIDFATQPQSFKEKVLKFVFDRYNRAMYGVRVSMQKNKFSKILLKLIFIGWILISHLRIILHLRSKEMGTSQWLIMQKKPHS